MSEAQNLGLGGSQPLGARGMLRLSSPPLPDLICMLTGLYQEGCCAAVKLQHLPADLSSQWRQALAPENALRVRLESYPKLGALELDAVCSRMVQTSVHCELEFRFHKLTPEQAAMLAKVVPSDQKSEILNPESESGRSAQHSELPPPDSGPPSPVRPSRRDRGVGEGEAQAAPASPGQTKQFRRIGEVLVQMGKLTVAQAEEAAGRARASGEKLGQVLLRAGLVSPGALCRALALQAGLPMTDLEGEEIPETLAEIFPLSLMARYEFVPFDDAGAFVCIAVSNALPPAAIKELERACHKYIEVFLAREDLIHKELQALKHRVEAQPRMYLRYEANYPVEYRFCTRLGVLVEQATHQGTTVNISEGGFMIDGPALDLGSPAELLRTGVCASVVVARGSPHEFSGLCRIKALKPQGNRCAIGLEVLSASAEDRRRLKELCLEAVRAQVKRFPTTA